jgi:hypothetical protein
MEGLSGGKSEVGLGGRAIYTLAERGNFKLSTLQDEKKYTYK